MIKKKMKMTGNHKLKKNRKNNKRKKETQKQIKKNNPQVFPLSYQDRKKN